jgi:O-6-methylguanine DNA methyltransferase
MINECVFDTPLARMLLKEKNGEITHSSFTEDKINKTSNRTLINAQNEILEYFKGNRKSFTIKVNPDGTHYQKKVWQLLLKIKYGSTKYYSDIANDIASSPRAIGNACGANKCLLIIPCHRVLSKDNNRSGYSSFGGLVHKDRLLELEKSEIK